VVVFFCCQRSSNPSHRGVYAPPIDKLTAQGYDLQIGTNVLGKASSCAQYKLLSVMYSGHFYFTKLLIPALLAGAKSSSDGKARVVNLSSVAAYMSKALDLDIAGDTAQRKKSSLTYLYSQSKLVRISGYDRPRSAMLTRVGKHPPLKRTCQEIWRPRDHILSPTSWPAAK
jgi:hypothetical protein